MFCIIEFVAWVVAVATSTAFVLGLLVKWHILDWLQLHAPNDLVNELLRCKFCCSFHVSVIISLTLLVATGYWPILLAPVCATVIARELW